MVQNVRPLLLMRKYEVHSRADEGQITLATAKSLGFGTIWKKKNK